ncbi:hypothetical protein [Paraherbaspirillum soli]|uniref:Uncharacterized protein n=1 Tax=Paraherbaspirillum soli TaxID=631222 RepID=A0ABW0MB86_9BURK
MPHPFCSAEPRGNSGEQFAIASSLHRVGPSSSEFATYRLGASKNRSERPKVGPRSAAVRRYGEHRRPEIGPRSRFVEAPVHIFQSFYPEEDLLKTLNNKRLILLELNEINFEFALAYAERKTLVHLKRVIKDARRTSSEAHYEQLEPWIQWVSVHTGIAAAEHGIVRLGDMAGSGIPQFFEAVEAAGYTVGAISAMNADNRLQQPAYFIPDPWTVTSPDRSFWSRALSKAVSQAVNDNSNERLSGRSLLALLGGLIRFARPRNYSRYVNLALRSRGRPWRKALFLDLFLHDLHLRMFGKKRPDFSTLFLNGGAFIQHHYLFNARAAVKTDLRNPDWYVAADQDPFAEMLEVYDRILGDYLALDDVDLIVATGLTQKPYDRVKYYWRLRDHVAFLDHVGVKYRAVFPRMTRDFMIEFDSSEAAKHGAEQLAEIVCEADGNAIFGEIDNRGASLFVTLTHAAAIEDELIVKQGNKRFDLKPHVVFVAIKNGMHEGRGFVYYKGRVADYAARDGLHVKELYKVVVDYFGLNLPARAAPIREAEADTHV